MYVPFYCLNKTLATRSGEVADFLRACGKFAPIYAAWVIEYAARNGASGPAGWCIQTGKMVHRHRRYGAAAELPLK